MEQDELVYDLGELEVEPRQSRAEFHPSIEGLHSRTTRSRSRSTAGRPGPRSIGPALASSLSIFLPGSGQLLAGEAQWGLFFLTATAFLATLIWAISATLDRLFSTFDLLGFPPKVLVCGLASFYVAASALHVSSVLQAHGLGYPVSERRGPHAILAGLASLLVPGWGQVLNGHRRRSALFLVSLWVLGAAWITVSPVGSHTLSYVDLRVPSGALEGWGPSTLVTLTAVVWVVAVYDAAAGATARRRER